MTIQATPAIHKSAKINSHCVFYKMKLHEMTDAGFIASTLVAVNAGMEYMPGTGKLISIPIKKIGNKRVYRKYIYHTDGDIQDDGIYMPEV